MSRNKEEVIARLERADRKVKKAEQAFDELKRLQKKLKSIYKNLEDLEDYYQNEWMEDVNFYIKNKIEKNYHSASQDAIWNVTQDHFEMKIKMLKTISKSL